MSIFETIAADANLFIIMWIMCLLTYTPIVLVMALWQRFTSRKKGGQS